MVVDLPAPFGPMNPYTHPCGTCSSTWSTAVCGPYCDAVCEAVWGADYYGYENSLNVHIRHLREKIEPDPGHPQWLHTVRGIGYRLAGEV